MRTNKGIIPTFEGEDFYNTCTNSMSILNNGIKKFSSLAKLESGTLNIGSSSTIIRKILLPFIKSFNILHPKVVITVTDANSEKLTKYLKNGNIDLAILNAPIPSSEMFVETPILTTNDCFIAPKNFDKEYLTNEDLKKQKLIVQKRPSSNRDYFELMCAKNNIKLNPSFEIGSFGLITDFVSDGMGIAYTIKEFVQDDINSGRVKIIDTEFVSAPRNISVITSQISTNSFTSQMFIDELKKYFK